MTTLSFASRGTLAVLIAIFISATVAGAIESDGFTLTDDNPENTKDFPPIVVSNPLTGVLADPTLDECKASAAANAVRVGLDLARPIAAKVTLTVSWPSESNDLDVYVFVASGELVGKSATGEHPEVVTLGGLANGDYFVCVINYLGASGFTLAGQVEQLTLYERPPVPPTSAPAPTREPATPDTDRTDRTVSPPVPTVPPETVRTPGPDGEPSERSLLAVAGGRQAEPPDDGAGAVQIALIALTIAISALGVGIVALRIRRDTS